MKRGPAVTRCSSRGSSWTEPSTSSPPHSTTPTPISHTCASAYDQLGKAAREVAKQLHNDDGQRELSSELARCSFCGKPARDVHKIITGPTSAICNECVDLCVEVLDEELGDDWRSPAARLTPPLRPTGHHGRDEPPLSYSL